MCNDMFINNLVIIIPIYNPDEKLKKLLLMLEKQSIEIAHVLLIDSGTNKRYRSFVSSEINIDIIEINSANFNHGGTRQWGIELHPEADIYVFFTQDAVLKDEFSVAKLIAPFDNDKIGAVYGRQLPYENATFFARTAREINYGHKSYVYSFADKETHGMKTCFMSNSFAAYRRIAMEDAGGFPTNTILSEDMYVAAKMLIKGWEIAYAADSCVYHSHNYTIKREFKRYFDIGVFHAREKWIREIFGEAEGEGRKFVLYEIKRIMQHNPLLIGEMLCRDIVKWCGYRLGTIERYLPKKIKKVISMNVRYWNG